MAAERTRTMYLLSRNGLPVKPWYGSKRQVVQYSTTGETGSPLYPFASLRTIRKHIRIATALPATKRHGHSYGYLILEVPNGR